MRAARRHKHNPLAGSYALLLACVAAFLLYLSFTAERNKVETVANHKHPVVVIKATASKWAAGRVSRGSRGESGPRR